MAGIALAANKIASTAFFIVSPLVNNGLLIALWLIDPQPAIEGLRKGGSGLDCRAVLV
jgi:hypothetical protein